MSTTPVSTILASYSPESISVVIAGDGFSYTVSGYADGTFLQISRLVPHAELYTGADGSNARVVRAVKNCDVTLTLHHASEANDVFSQLLRNDEDTRDGTALFSLTIKDLTGRTVASSPVCFIGTSPDISFDTGITERDWVLKSIALDIHEGGNGKFTQDTYDVVTGLGYTPNSFWNP